MAAVRRGTLALAVARVSAVALYFAAFAFAFSRERSGRTRCKQT